DKSKKNLANIKKEAKIADQVYLATDLDREGEAIAWHVAEMIGQKDAKRITFHEITKDALVNAVKNPGKLNENLFNAQQARRILDRLVGYELSPVLWKKVQPSLSAGRVQSVAVRLIVERERKIQDHESTSFYKTTALFTVGDAILKAELNKKFGTRQEAEDFLNNCKTAKFDIQDLVKKPAKKNPSAPFTTSTLQQEAARKLGFSVARTMSVAQKLYEAGHITYMRTDSLNLSEASITASQNEIVKSFSKEYSRPMRYTTKSKGAQEAHEAIHPTVMSIKEAGSDLSEEKLYSLIWKRTLASQMSEARLERTTVTISVSGRKEEFIAEGEVIQFDGFLKVYIESSDDEANSTNKAGILPPMKVGQKLQYDEIFSTQRFTLHPPHYTEASLVKKMEELGIGRPSTYAPTISTIQKRNYIVKETREGEARKYDYLSLKSGEFSCETKEETTGAEKQKLFPTDIGMLVTDFLVEKFGEIMDYGFTASVEEEFDEVADGKLKWDKMISKFYGPFHTSIEKVSSKENSDSKPKSGRKLGIDPVSGREVFARIGRFGPIIQIGKAEDEEKPKFASLQKDQSIFTITFEEAMELFKLPRVVGKYEDKDVVANVGRFGPYVSHDGLFASINKDGGDDPMTIELDRAIELIEEKRKANKERILKTFSEDKNAQVLKGRWGPFLKVGKDNYRIPKDTDIESLTYDDIQKIIIEGPTKKTWPKKKKA
ncbi:MAG: type I DNA topoisomerase, partial [Patescibacteria group bacterium]